MNRNTPAPCLSGVAAAIHTRHLPNLCSAVATQLHRRAVSFRERERDVLAPAVHSKREAQQLKLNTMFPMHAGRRASQCTVNMVSAESGASHAVTMVTKVTSPGNRHHRFTTGWSKFFELAGVDIGDEVCFTRQGRRGNELMVQVLKNAGRRAG